MKKTILFAVAILCLGFAGKAYSFTVQGFQNPYGVVVDIKTDYIYVSSMMGDPTARDDNGFISRMKTDGTMDQLKFIDGASKDIELHAPKGMVVLDGRLYVADIDKLRVFDAITGKLLFNVNFGELPVQHFFGITADSDGILYLTDGPANIIYRIDVPRLHEVTTFAQGDWLGNPHGVIWNGGGGFFAVTAKTSGQVIVLDKTGKRAPAAAIFLKEPEGLAVDESGILFVASPALSSIYRLPMNFAISSLVLGLKTPTGISYDSDLKQIVWSSMDDGKVSSIPVK